MLYIVPMGLKDTILSLLGERAGKDAAGSHVIRTSHAHPVIRYVDDLLWQLRSDASGSVSLRASEPLPHIQGDAQAVSDDVSYETVVNRLKVLCGLQPITYAKSAQGKFERDVRDRKLRVRCRFTDSGPDASCSINVMEIG